MRVSIGETSSNVLRLLFCDDISMCGTVYWELMPVLEFAVGRMQLVGPSIYVSGPMIHLSQSGDMLQKPVRLPA